MTVDRHFRHESARHTAGDRERSQGVAISIHPAPRAGEQGEHSERTDAGSYREQLPASGISGLRPSLFAGRRPRSAAVRRPGSATRPFRSSSGRRAAQARAAGLRARRDSGAQTGSGHHDHGGPKERPNFQRGFRRRRAGPAGPASDASPGGNLAGRRGAFGAAGRLPSVLPISGNAFWRSPRTTLGAPAAA